MKVTRKTPTNAVCFECKKPITQRDITFTMVQVNAYPYYFHFACNVKVLCAHVADTNDREQWAAKRASELQNADVLATRLGYTHQDLALEYEERKAIQEEPRLSERKAGD